MGDNREVEGECVKYRNQLIKQSPLRFVFVLGKVVRFIFFVSWRGGGEGCVRVGWRVVPEFVYMRGRVVPQCIYINLKDGVDLFFKKLICESLSRECSFTKIIFFLRTPPFCYGLQCRSPWTPLPFIYLF